MNSEIAAHPYAISILISLLFAGIIGILKLFLVLFERRMNEKFDGVERHNTKQDDRLDEIENDLKRYDTHVALGVKESNEIHTTLARVEATLGNHVQKEETVTWQKIDDLVEAVNVMRLANEAAHGTLTTGQATLGIRVEAVEKKMPNGELQKLADAYHALAQRDAAISTRRRRKMR
jgi:hypothetical protein